MLGLLWLNAGSIASIQLGSIIAMGRRTAGLGFRSERFQNRVTARINGGGDLLSVGRRAKMSSRYSDGGALEQRGLKRERRTKAFNMKKKKNNDHSMSCDKEEC